MWSQSKSDGRRRIFVVAAFLGLTSHRQIKETEKTTVLYLPELNINTQTDVVQLGFMIRNSKLSIALPMLLCSMESMVERVINQSSFKACLEIMVKVI